MRAGTFPKSRIENEVFAQFNHPTSGIYQQRCSEHQVCSEQLHILPIREEIKMEMCRVEALAGSGPFLVG